jgi:hypothetical protein
MHRGGLRRGDRSPHVASGDDPGEDARDRSGDDVAEANWGTHARRRRRPRVRVTSDSSARRTGARPALGPDTKDCEAAAAAARMLLSSCMPEPASEVADCRNSLKGEPGRWLLLLAKRRQTVGKCLVGCPEGGARRPTAAGEEGGLSLA